MKLVDGGYLRDAGMEIAMEAQESDEPGWGDRAYEAIVCIALNQPTVHVDDVLREFRELPNHPNAWGVQWRRAIKNGVLRRGETMRQSQDPRKHKHWYPVYESEVWGK